MLATVANVWRLRLHREVVGIAQTCQQCKTADKNNKPLLRQKQVEQLPKCNEINREITIDFAGPFQNEIGAKKYMLVSPDHNTGWPEAKVLRKPNTNKVMEILKRYILRHGFPKTIRTFDLNTKREATHE